MSDTSQPLAGPTLAGLVVGDEPTAWRDAGFDVQDDLVVTGGLALRLVGSRGPRGLLRWLLTPPTTSVCDGLDLAAPEELPAPLDLDSGHAHLTSDPAHPNGVIGLDHVVVTTDDLERTTAALGELGLAPRRTVVGVRGDGDDELAYRFFLLGTCVLELVGPTEPAGAGPARFAGLAFTSTAVEELGDLTGTPRDAVQPGRRIATLRGQPLGISVPVALLSPRPRRSS